jgi:gliding motility-associated-like protein
MKRLKYILVVVGFMSLAPKGAEAQIDTTFWFAAPWVTPDHWWLDPVAFHVSAFNQATTVRIQQPASTYDTTFVVAANGEFTKYVDFMLNLVESKPADAVLNTGFKITSDFPITVVYDIITRPTQHYNPETYSLKGQNGMGYEFVTPFQTRWNNQTLTGDLDGLNGITQPYQQFSVVATEDNTLIYITPRCDVVGGHPANVTYAVLLPVAGNVYTCQNVVQNTSTLGNNMAGSVVVSDKPVSVSVSDDSVNPSGGGSCYDLMGDQIVPTDVIGKEYIVNKGFLNAGSDESLFVLASENFTTVTIDNGLGTTTTILNQGDTYSYSVTEPLTYINADKNVYLLHMSGYGCELGEAILPPLNCAGSDQVSFSRNNPQSFLLDIICPLGAESSFVLNGNAALVTGPMFNPVPGTGGQWLGTQISFNTADVPVGAASLITNSTDLFSLGIINGGSSTGCLYHYMSSFLRRVYTKAGNDTTLCNGEPLVDLNGSVTGGTTTGVWSVLNGSGTLNSPTNLVTDYVPSASDYAQGTLTFVLSSTGNCEPVTDTVVVNYIQSPSVDAGPDDSYCDNNVPPILINGALAFAAGSMWSGGNGGAFGNVGNLSTTYTPSPADIAADSVILYFTSAGSFFACPNDEDTLVIFFTDPPLVQAGPSVTICSSAADFALAGTVTGVSTTGAWTSSGSGAFSPSQTDLNADYLISGGDTAVGSITMVLTSTNNNNCVAVQDSFTVTFLDQPRVNILTDDSICSNLATINLDGTVSSGFSVTWSSSGAGLIVSPGVLSTFYNLSPIDTINGFIDIFLSTTGGICPVEQDSVRIIFIDPPRVDAGGDQSFCSNEPIQLNGSIAGTSPAGTWTSTGTGSFVPSPDLLQTIYFPSAADVGNGTVNLILTSTNNFGCIPDADTMLVTFIDPPVANFAFNDACAGSNTIFTDQSTATGGTVNTWVYDFGDQSSSIASDPQHNYPDPGTYSVILITGSSNGCFDTIMQTITVNPVPIADFNNGLACVGEPTQLTDVSFISSGTLVSWDWDFDNAAGVSTDQNPTHVFSGSGSFPVTLTVTSDLGCIATISQNISVLAGPTAAFSMAPSPAIALEDVFFTDESTGAQIIGWFWDFGDESGGNLQNEIHDYADGGDYAVILTVTDANGCSSDATEIISVALLPVLPTAFTPNGSGDNDMLLIRGGPFVSVDFNIYNNWGELIFSSDDVDVGWDGTFQGTDAPIGVYTWTFQVGIAGGRVVSKSGDVTLMR